MTTTDLVIPTTGEVIQLDDPVACARAWVELDKVVDQIKEMQAVLGEAILDESVRVGSKTLHFGAVTASVVTPKDVSWHYETLRELLEAGLPEERFDDLVSVEKKYKINRSVANQLSKSNPVYAEIIERAKTEREKSSYVRIAEK